MMLLMKCGWNRRTVYYTFHNSHDFYDLLEWILKLKLKHWIKNNLTVDPVDIVNNFNKIISGDIHRALLKYDNKREV